jgi:hypothetical protein
LLGLILGYGYGFDFELSEVLYGMNVLGAFVSCYYNASAAKIDASRMMSSIRVEASKVSLPQYSRDATEPVASKLSSISIDIAILSHIFLSSPSTTSNNQLRQQSQTSAFIYSNQPFNSHNITTTTSQPPKITSPTFNMQYSIVFLSAMAATGSLAAPQAAGQGNPIDVRLQNQALELGSGTSFVGGVLEELPPVGSSGPFETVELNLEVQDGSRCQILNADNVPILVFRDPNFDFTFADANGGPWTIVNGPREVETIICDPDFVGTPLDFNIKVTLSDGDDLISETQFSKIGNFEVLSPVGSFGPFNTVNLTIGAEVRNQDLRCQIIDDEGHAIELVRGDNEAFTFADAGAGEWTFLDPTSSLVEKIICDPLF